MPTGSVTESPISVTESLQLFLSVILTRTRGQFFSNRWHFVLEASILHTQPLTFVKYFIRNRLFENNEILRKLCHVGNDSVTAVTESVGPQ